MPSEPKTAPSVNSLPRKSLLNKVRMTSTICSTKFLELKSLMTIFSRLVSGVLAL